MPNWRPWDEASDAEWALAIEREAVIRPLAQQPAASAADIADAMAMLGASRSLVYRLVARYRSRPLTSSLLPFKRGRGAYSRFLDDAPEDLLKAVIKEFYLKPERPSLADLVREVRRRFSEAGIPAPHPRTVQRRVQAIDPALELRKRHGHAAARAKTGTVGASTLRADSPLDVVQIDHTQADVIVVDQERRLPLGRPHLSLGIDVATRMVVGFYLSMDKPSSLSVALALTHCVLPKDDWLADRDLDVEWPVSGLPRSVHLDNAQEFHAAALVRGCEEHHIQIEHRPFRQPHFGGHIERLIGTMMGAVHLLPGTTFSDVHEKASYDSEGKAALTLPELERWLALQIAGVYHVTKHRALGTTPLEAWHQGMAVRRRPVHHPSDATEFFLDFLPAVARKVARDGIHFHGIRYWSSVLSPWAGRLKESLWVKYDPRNISRVFVRDPNGRHWPIPYADLRRPRITLWELLAERKRQAQGGQREAAEQVTFSNILAQRRIVQDAARHSQHFRRQAQGPALAPPPDEAALRESTTVKELKPFPVEHWDSEDDL